MKCEQDIVNQCGALCQSKVVWAWAQTAQPCNEGRTAGSGSRKRTVCLETSPEEGSPRHWTKSETLKWKLSKEDESHNKDRSALCSKISEDALFCWSLQSKEMMLLKLLTALRNERAIVHRTEKASSLSRFGAWCPGNKAREAAQPSPPSPATAQEAWFSFSSFLLLKESNSHL